MRFRLLLAVALAVPFLGAGCRKETVDSYRIPKEKDPEIPLTAGPSAAPAMSPAAPDGAGGSMAATPVATASGADLTWTAPAAWKAKPASAMRKGSYSVPGAGGAEADLSITAFPGDVGGELANLNRWRGQVQLPPVGESELASQIQRVEHNGLQFGVVDVAGPGGNANRILGAYVRQGAATWFFKLQGPDTVVTAAKPSFLAFLETIKPAPAATQ